jgi:hypothetical protein
LILEGRASRPSSADVSVCEKTFSIVATIGRLGTAVAPWNRDGFAHLLVGHVNLNWRV